MNRKVASFILLSFCAILNVKADVIKDAINEALKLYSDSVSKVRNLDSLLYPENLIFVEHTFPFDYKLDSIPNIHYIYDIKKEPREIRKLFKRGKTKRGKTLINVYSFLDEDRLTIRLFLYGGELKKWGIFYWVWCWDDYYYNYDVNTKQWRYIGHKQGCI